MYIDRLSGFYVKSAQILGSKAEFMPSEWTEKLSILFDQFPAASWQEIRPAIRKELNDSPLVKHANALKTNPGSEMVLPVTDYSEMHTKDSDKGLTSRLRTIVSQRSFSVTSADARAESTTSDRDWIDKTVNVLNSSNDSIEDKIFTRINHDALATATIAYLKE